MTRRSLLIRLLTLLAFSALSHAASAGTAYLRIDGRYYVIDPVEDAIQYDMSTSLWQVKAAALNNCRRGNGLPPQLGLHGVIGLPSFTVVYTNSTNIEISQAPLVIGLATPSGDVICDGSVAGPPIQPQVLFANGFD